MSTLSPTIRLTRLAILAVAGATALSVAGCSSSNNETPNGPAGTSGSSSASANGKDHVIGQIASVSGNTFEVTQPSGTATVDFTDSTKITEGTPAQLTDVTAGSCVKVGPTPDSAPASSGAITAKWVSIGTAVDGKCPQRQQPQANSTSTVPSAAPKQHRGVRGIVDSVSGNTITVTRTDASGNTSQTTVTVTDTTKYGKRAAADTKAIAEGKCVSARGSKDNNGALQATKVAVWPATDGKCPQPTGKHHGHGG